MIVKTESDGEMTDVFIEAEAGKFGVRLTILNNERGTTIIYEDSENNEYSLLEVDGKGVVTSEVPKLLS